MCSDQTAKPLVTIGIPVLNGERSIAAALDDFLDQSYPNWKLVVCDNASDDRTADIVEAYAQRDARIHLKRHSERVPVFHSFIRALNIAEGDYFMFAPADDRHYRTFLEKTVAALEDDPSAAAACSKVAFVNEGHFDGISTGTEALTGTADENICKYLGDPHDNSRLFSLFRTSAVKDCWPEAVIPGIDYHAVARILRLGTTIEIDEVLMERDRTPQENYVQLNQSLAGSFMTRWMPNLRVAWAIWRDRELPNSLSLARALVSLIYSSFKVRLDVLYPKIGATLSALKPRIDRY